MTAPSDRAAGGRRKRRPPAAPPAPPTPPELVGEGLRRRLPAGIIDAVLVFVLMDTLAIVANAVGSAAPVLRLAAILMPLVYFFLFESITQTTPGKRLFGMRVVTTDGGQPGLAEHLLRAATRVPEALIVLPYVISIKVSARNQRLGDSATDTLVVRADGPLVSSTRKGRD